MPLRMLLGLFALLLLSGCGANSYLLTPAETTAHYTALAAHDVGCAEGERGCHESHLVKGEACLRLAAAGEERFRACAVRHLALGVDMSPKNADKGTLQAYHESLLEALRLRRDNAVTRSEAAPFAAQLESRARSFRKNFPTAPAGYFYLASARLKRAADAGEAAPVIACRALDDAETLLTGAPRDLGLYGPEFTRAKAALQELRSNISNCADA